MDRDDVTITTSRENARLLSLIIRENQDYYNNVIKESPHKKVQDQNRAIWCRLEQLKNEVSKVL